VTSLKNGGYFPYYVKPGKIKLVAETTESKSEVELELKADQTVYVKGTIQMGAIGARANIQLTDESTGERELASCKLIPEEK